MDMHYTIKPLEWEREDNESLTASTLIGPLVIQKSNVSDMWTVAHVGGGFLRREPSIEAAKAAAESWYHSRLAAALEPVDESELRKAAKEALALADLAYQVASLYEIDADSSAERIEQQISEILTTLRTAIGEQA